MLLTGRYTQNRPPDHNALPILRGAFAYGVQDGRLPKPGLRIDERRRWSECREDSSEAFVRVRVINHGPVYPTQFGYAGAAQSPIERYFDKHGNICSDLTQLQ